MPHQPKNTHADLLYFNNNGTVGVAPGLTGRLRSLVQRTRDNVPKVWVFRDVGTITERDGTEHVDVLTRGVVCGSLNEADTFLKFCIRLGLYPQNDSSLYVPCSNGLIGATDEHRRTVLGWDPRELALLRFDLPTGEELARLVSGHLALTESPRLFLPG